MATRSNFRKKTEDIAKSKKDSASALLDGLGDLSKETVLHSQVLVATYVQPEMTQGGIILPGQSRDEDRFQGTIGLVVKMGPGAFKDDGVAKFHGVKLKVGDWVLFRPADGMEMFIREVPCRLFEDVNIKMVISDPQMYW